MSGDAISRLWRRLCLAIGAGRIQAVNDAGPAQILQVKMGQEELLDNVPRVAEYGFTSVPPAGTDAVVVFIAGERSNGVCIGTNNQQVRLRNLANGDVAIYDNRGRTVRLTASGTFIDGGSDLVEVSTGGDVIVESGGNALVSAVGDLTLSGNRVIVNASEFHVNAATAFAGAVNANGHSIDESHIHTGGTISGKTGPVTP